ncbi:hypothetical protein GCM10010517_54610 [Streptosporangium fragile]|uniref:Uncharacterized protein n=1 Tax=Streptosporangium fragile TaxID=46186 RepID=A0ABN3W4N8_9ACTN
MSLGLSGVVLLAVAPLTGPSRADATVRVVVAQPSEIPGCDVDPAGPCPTEEPTPVVTVTQTVDPTATAVPQETVTTTVTVPPKTQTPTTTTTAPAPPPQETSAPPQETAAPPVVPSAAPTATQSEEPDVQFPSADTSQPIPSAEPSPNVIPTPQNNSSTSALELRNAGSEFDGATLSRQLGIPALILVLLVLFAVLIFEGRLRRLAHAAAVRRAGPRPGGYRADPMDPGGYPAVPGYGPGFGYQTGTAYAPIISLVPMQMYAPVYPEGYPPEQFQHPYEHTTAQYPYEHTTAFVPPPGQEQQPGAYGQAPYGPVGQPGQDVPPAAFHGPGVPPPGPVPHEGPLPQGPWQERPGEGVQSSGPERPEDSSGGDRPQGEEGRIGPQEGFPPLGPQPPLGPEQGGPDGPRQGPGGEFHPFGPEPAGGRPAQGTAEFPGAPFPQEPGQGGPGEGFRPFGPEPGPGGPVPGMHGPVPGMHGGPGQGSPAGPPPPGEPAQTAVYPLPGQETGKKKRGLFRRST